MKVLRRRSEDENRPAAEPGRLRFGRYDCAAFLSFASYAATSLSIPVVLVAMGGALGFPLDAGGMSAGGALHLVRSAAMCAALVACTVLAARLGNRRTLRLSLSLMTAGIVLCAAAPSYAAVVAALALAGLGEGLLEGIGTPFAQDLHADEPSRYVNFTHAFWSLGILVAVPFFGWLVARGCSWRAPLLVCGAAGLLCVALLGDSRRAPYPERAPRAAGPAGAAAPEARVSEKLARIARDRRFWGYFAAMFLGGGGEFCLTFWSASFIQLSFAGSALAGGVGTAAFSAGMFAGRTSFAAFVGEKHLGDALFGAGVWATASSLALVPLAHLAAPLPPASSLGVLFGLLFLCGLGAAPLWPSIQSLAVARLPRLDATQLFILLSCAGVPGCGFFTWLMGAVGDRAGLDASFLLAPCAFAAMSLLLLALRPR